MEAPGPSPPSPSPRHAPGEFDIARLDYDLPEELIAQHPRARREDSRLLVVDRGADACRDQSVRDLPALLAPGDLLVLNDTKVIPARFFARRDSGGLIEGLFIEEDGAGRWRAMLKRSRRIKPDELLRLVRPEAIGRDDAPTTDDGPRLRMLSPLPEGQWLMAVEPFESAESLLTRYGRTPLPPYIRRSDADAEGEIEDRPRYQTVYARVPGAVAAPTAGLHLTPGLLDDLHKAGVSHAFVTLHVGLGTFKPVAAERLSEHVMHTERFVLPPETREAIVRCRAAGGRVVAVGTTSVRVLESCATADGVVEARGGSTDIFIYPPYRFRVVDGLLTNFHLPRSTLLALVMAMAGEGLIRRAYAHAIRERYRFFSYGDAMFITPPRRS
jgi:S-adenosylmethionine:tRNA ribosyltransferase-isomerase